MFCMLYLITVLLISSSDVARPESNNGIYIVYMGAAPTKNSVSSVVEILESVKSNAVVHTYKHGFSGFTARLSEEEARSMAQKPGVVSVFPDPLLQLHTTRSWDFLNNYQKGIAVDSSFSTTSSEESDTIIGIMDSGIWPESESFNDKDMGPVPTRWKGVCMNGTAQQQPFYCNRKVIGARTYYGDNSARDNHGHGTHVASIAAGSHVANASYYGLARGTAKGGSPTSRIAVCTRFAEPWGCQGSSILAAFDDAIADGVDILSISLGSPSTDNPRFDNDVIAIGAFHAVERGIVVVCSAGNDGPDRGTVVNAAPWIITVGASTIDRDFESDVVLALLGGNKVIKGGGISFSSLKKSPAYPVIDGVSAKSEDVDDYEARYCLPLSLDKSKVKGKIVVCDSLSSGKGVVSEVKRCKGVGVIIVDDQQRMVASNFGKFPTSVVTSAGAAHIRKYINTTRYSRATIRSTVTVRDNFAAPTIAYFSARGPSARTSVLKPDVTGPGVNIIAAWIRNDSPGPGNGTPPPPPPPPPPAFKVLSGTSMSCPHVSGIAATIKSRNPLFSPSAIKSAIITTATQTDDTRNPITTHTGAIATPYEYGAGEINPTRSLDPGLVYELNTTDYLYFLCHANYTISDINNISNDIPHNYSCPEKSNKTIIADINYPSIAISWTDARHNRSVSRTLTNVVTGDEHSADNYNVQVDAPIGVSVEIVPKKLVFKGYGDKQSYNAIFSATTTSTDMQDQFGLIKWSNGKYSVQIPFVSN